MKTCQEPLIYVVDDDQDEHYLLKRVFADQQTNYGVRCFSDGAELMTQLTHRLDHRLPDLILLDLQMPILSGYEVLCLLKRDADFKSIPIVVYSTSASDADVNRCTDLGCTAFIIKPDSYLRNDGRLLNPYFILNSNEN